MNPPQTYLLSTIYEGTTPTRQHGGGCCEFGFGARFDTYRDACIAAEAMQSVLDYAYGFQTHVVGVFKGHRGSQMDFGPVASFTTECNRTTQEA